MVKVFFLLFLITACSSPTWVPNENIFKHKAPSYFKILFKTTKGNFILEVDKTWSPLGADRLYQLVKTGFYNNTILFRVQHDYVTQFGIADSKRINLFWDPRKLPDEPRQQSNVKGMVSFAREGTNSRATQLFINMIDNPQLDTINRNGMRGYVPVARVLSGMQVIGSFFDRYGRSTLAHQDSVYLYGNSYLEKNFPGLDKVINASIIP